MEACLYVFAITATPFNLELSNFGITVTLLVTIASTCVMMSVDFVRHHDIDI